MTSPPPRGPCPDRDVLAAFLREELPPAERDAIGSHVLSCPACAAAIRERDEANEAWLRRLFGDFATAEFPQADRNGTKTFGGAVRAGDSRVEQRVPERLGQYESLHRIGRGGMGVVYRARHARLKKSVALKLLPAHRLDDPRLVARFEREMEVVGRLDHPNIVRATDAGFADGFHYLVMELIDGIDLARLLRRRGPLPVPAACEIVRQAATGLQHAHENGLVHRDVKPGNLMLTAKGEVKVLDLGLALLRDDLATSTFSASGVVLGTADYMAPEQWESSHDVDIRADIYSLGCTLFALLAGSPPFSGGPFDTLYQKLRAHQEAPAPSLSSKVERLPDGLEDLVRRMLEKDPAQRPQVPADVARELVPFCQGSDLVQLYASLGDDPEPLSDETPSAVVLRLTSETSTEGHPTTVTDASPRRRRFLVRTVALIACSAALALGSWLSWRAAHPTPAPNTETEPPPAGPQQLGHAGPQDPPPRVFKAGEWCELLDRPPREVFSATKGATRTHHDPSRNTLTVIASDAVMLELAAVSAAGFDLEATFVQTPWTGGVGVYLRGWDGAPEGQDRLAAEAIWLSRIGGSVANQASFQYAEIRRFVNPPHRAYFHPILPPGEITPPTGQDHRLSLTVGETGLVSVHWDETPVPGVCQAAGSSKRKGASGTVGIWGQNSTTHFSSIRVRPHLPPGDAK